MAVIVKRKLDDSGHFAWGAFSEMLARQPIRSKACFNAMCRFKS